MRSGLITILAGAIKIFRHIAVCGNVSRSNPHRTAFLVGLVSAEQVSLLLDNQIGPHSLQSVRRQCSWSLSITRKPLRGLAAFLFYATKRNIYE